MPRALVDLVLERLIVQILVRLTRAPTTGHGCKTNGTRVPKDPRKTPNGPMTERPKDPKSPTPNCESENLCMTCSATA